MKVAELLVALAQADPESRVLFLAEHADLDEAREVAELRVETGAWTYERGSDYDVWYPGEPETGEREVSVERMRVVVLSTGPTNLTPERAKAKALGKI